MLTAYNDMLIVRKVEFKLWHQKVQRKIKDSW